MEVENLYFSVDPYMRGRMTGEDSYVTGFALHETMTGEAIGRVTVSRDPAFTVGDLIVHHHGWRTHAVLRATECRRVPELDDVDASAHLGILGMPGMAAFVGLFDIARFRPGDTVFVSAASGAVGSAVGQFAKLNGASRVIGSAGSADKAVQLVDEFGFDDAFDYHQGPIAGLLADAAPDGIDVYYDNVGGEHLQAAFDALHPHGRIALCGAIAEYNHDSTFALADLSSAIDRRISICGFIVYDHEARRAEFEREVGQWLSTGRLQVRATVFDSIHDAVPAFRSLFTGAKLGKVVVRARTE